MSKEQAFFRKYPGLRVVIDEHDGIEWLTAIRRGKNDFSYTRSTFPRAHRLADAREMFNPSLLADIDVSGRRINIGGSIEAVGADNPMAAVDNTTRETEATFMSIQPYMHQQDGRVRVDVEVDIRYGLAKRPSGIELVKRVNVGVNFAIEAIGRGILHPSDKLDLGFTYPQDAQISDTLKSNDFKAYYARLTFLAKYLTLAQEQLLGQTS